MSTVISVENLSKSYRLGLIGGGTLREDLSRWWAALRHRPDPGLKIGEEARARHIGQEFWALQDVSFAVKEGEILGIIGRNGAGKSTLLKILSRVTGPTSGHVKIKGRIASLLEVGTGFHPELTGKENIFLNGTILGMTKAEIRRKFDEIVDFAEIDEFIDTPVKRYSSGMYVRLAFAVAAHLEPEILIVDEVLAVGDAQFQKKCLGKMGEVSRAGRTVLFVSHNMMAVQQLCDRAILLKTGGIEFCGDVSQAIERYLTRSDLTKDQGTEDVRAAPRKIANPQSAARFQCVQMCNSRGDFVNEVMFGELFDLIFTIEVKSTIDHALVGFAVKSSDGVCLFTSHWDDCTGARDLSAGTEVLRCKVDPAVLRPGTYSIDIAILDSIFQFQDNIEDAFSFTVLDVPCSREIKLDKRPGSMMIPLQWADAGT